jgi:hypothetical protein
MSEEKKNKLTLRDLAAIHNIDFGLLGKWQKEGVDINNSTQVAIRAIKSKSPPSSWVGVKDCLVQNANEDSHEHWKLQKTKEEVESLRLKNAKAAGQMFDKSDGERIQEAWASALKSKLAERRATAPPVLAGKDEAAIYSWFEREDDELLTELSDLESGLWRQVDEKNMQIDEASVDDEEGGIAQAAATGKPKRLVRKKRVSGSGSYPET